MFSDVTQTTSDTNASLPFKVQNYKAVSVPSNCENAFIDLRPFVGSNYRIVY